MRIKVEDEAKKKILRTARYIQNQFGKEARVEFRNEIHRVVKLLSSNPLLGPLEPLLADAPVPYRSIVVRHLNKFVYWINNDVIEIIDFWDCRREPKKQAEQTIAHNNNA
jgi:plasmid stabilization system protein ParE